MQVDILNTEGKPTGRQIELADDIFKAEGSDHMLYLAVKQYQANQRQGTHKAKERAEITGSTRKIKRQKGTGTARAGSLKSPLFRGGGRVFGPRPHGYEQKLNKKVKRQARKLALSKKMAEGNLVVIENFSFDAPKTKSYMEIVKKLEVAGTSHVVVLGAEGDQNVYLSGRNVAKAEVLRASDLNTYAIMRANKVILSEDAVGHITELLSK